MLTGEASRRADFGDGDHPTRALACTFHHHVITMPKTLVLFHGGDADLIAMAEAVADGVRSVRFAEVDLRQLADSAAPGGGRHRTLATAEELAGYDGLVLGAAAGGADIPGNVTRLLTEAASLRKQGQLTVSVGAAFARGDADSEWGLLRALGALGVVLVPPGAADAKQLGHRVAHVVSWITHARSHHHH